MRPRVLADLLDEQNQTLNAEVGKWPHVPQNPE
jgi:hypothetical protein